MVDYANMAAEQLLGMLIGEEASEGMMKVFPSLPYAVIQSTEEELLQVKQIGPRRAMQIKAFGELARRLYKAAPTDIHKTIKGPQDVVDLVMADLRYLKREQFHIMLLDTKNKLIEQRMVSEGSLSSSIVHPREVFSLAVKRSASGAIFIHNHPSGIPEPSKEDIETTARLVNAGNILGIKVLDHVIIGDGIYTSLKEGGWI